MARPRIFKTVEEMQKAIDAYFKKQKRNGRPLTVQGLALALGFNTRKSFLDYEGYTDEKSKPFLNTIKKAKLLIEENKVENLILGEGNPTGLIFDLKNNHGHVDKVEQQVNHSGNVSISPIEWINDSNQNK